MLAVGLLVAKAEILSIESYGGETGNGVLFVASVGTSLVLNCRFAK